MLEIYYKKDFLKEIKRFCNHSPQKLKGLLVKVGLSLSFGCMRLKYRSLGARRLLFKQALKRFLKLSPTLY
ncbi:hypothetical protein C2R93_01050 [Helicobacter pylori]|nr:hypothetical protein C2R93_01050 [Helicobacter pylori]